MQHWFAKWWSRGPVWLGLSLNHGSMTLVQWRAAGTEPLASPRCGQDACSIPATDPWQDPVGCGAQVQTLVRRLGVRCRRLAMGVPAERVVQQRLQVDADLPAGELRAQVQWSASQALGLAWDEVACDHRFDEDGEALATGAPRTVHWLACPLSLVQAAQQISQAAGLSLQFLGVEPAHSAQEMAEPSAAPKILTPVQVACELARQGAQS